MTSERAKKTPEGSIIAVSAAKVLCVCNSSPPVRLAQARVVAWVGPDRVPVVTRTQVKSEILIPVDRNREIKLAALPNHPPEWWAVLNAIEAEEDARLAKILVICKGCFDPIGDDHWDHSNR